MIHEIDATTGEITRTWDTGTYWIDHQAYIDLARQQRGRASLHHTRKTPDLERTFSHAKATPK